MNNLFFSLRAAVVSAEALRSNPTQVGVGLLCQALLQVQVQLSPALVKAPIVPLSPSMPPIEDPSPMRVDHPLAVQEINGCKALLLEIVRRAAYDWVLYRTSGRIQHKKLAEDAYYWLFVEEMGHPRWTERQHSQKAITSFVSICEVLDLDPDAVRQQVRKLTVKNVMSVGRPAEYRRNDWRGDEKALPEASDESLNSE